jgi:O-antigen/teichoic acid export membrane protein
MALITIATYIFGSGIVGISCAYLGLGVWSLIVASLAQGLLSLFLTFFLVRRKIGFTIRLSMRNPLLHYGGKTTVIAILEYAGYNIDNLFIGRLLGSNMLGIYSRSFAIINLPVNFISAALSRVLFPSFARVQNNLEKLRSGLLLGMFITAMISFPVACGVIPAAREIITVLLGQQWLEGVPTLQILALFMAFDICSTVPAVICASIGQLKAKFKLQFGFVLLELVLVLGAIPFGLRGIATAVVLANAVRWGTYLMLMRRIFNIPLAVLFGTQLPAIILAIIICGDILLVRLIFSSLTPWILLLLEISSAGIILISYVFFSKNYSIVQSRNLVLQSFPFLWSRTSLPQTSL